MNLILQSGGRETHEARSMRADEGHIYLLQYKQDILWLCNQGALFMGEWPMTLQQLSGRGAPLLSLGGVW
jgi:hypothetical protein